MCGSERNDAGARMGTHLSWGYAKDYQIVIGDSLKFLDHVGLW